MPNLRSSWTPPIIGWQYQLHWTLLKTEQGLLKRGTNWTHGKQPRVHVIGVLNAAGNNPKGFWEIAVRIPQFLIIIKHGLTIDMAIQGLNQGLRGIPHTLAAFINENRKEWPNGYIPAMDFINKGKAGQPARTWREIIEGAVAPKRRSA